MLPFDLERHRIRNLRDQFIITIDTTKNTDATNKTVSIVVYYQASDSSIYVDWGDGITERFQGVTPTHTYLSSGVYNISVMLIRGVKPQKFTYQNATPTPISLQLTDSTMSSYSITNQVNLQHLFISPNSKIDELKLFYNPILNSGNFNSWDLSNVTTLGNDGAYSGVLQGCTNFNQPIDKWNVSNVTQMFGTFWDCKAFNQPLNNWNVSNVFTMYGMLLGCTNFNQPLDKWDVSNVLNMAVLFNGALAFNQDISMWNFNKNVVLERFMNGKSSTNYNKEYYDSLLQKLSQRLVGTGRTQTDKRLGMGAIKYTSVGKPYRDILVSDGWVITDGGITT